MKSTDLTIKLEDINLSEEAKSRILKRIQEVVTSEISGNTGTVGDADDVPYCGIIVPHKWIGMIYRPFANIAQVAEVQNEGVVSGVFMR